MERKTLEIKQLSDEGVGAAVFATFGVPDADNDVTLPGAFGEQDVKILPAHDWGTVPLGKGRTRETETAAIVDFRLNLATQAGKDWHSALKFDLAHGRPIQEWSYGFQVLASSEGTHEGQRVRVLERMKVHEVSPVVLGAGIGTGTLAIKARMTLPDEIEAVLAEIVAVATRVKDVRRLRAEEGRDISPERRRQFAGLIERVKGLGVELEEVLVTEPDPVAEAARREYLRYLHLARNA